jgi:DNA-directed RNA polymerase sigma subunit (sigma70/sigma32)
LERARAIRDARAAGLTLAGIAEHLRVSTERVRQMGAILDDTPADASA